MVQVCGRLTKQPELRTTPTGVNVLSLAIATNRTWKGKDGAKNEDTEFHNAVAFSKTAEVIAQYFGKGDEIYIIGRLQTSSWDDKDTGKKRYKTDIVIERFEFGQKSKANQANQANQNNQQPRDEGVQPGTGDTGSQVSNGVDVINVDDDIISDDDEIDVSKIPFN